MQKMELEVPTLFFWKQNTGMGSMGSDADAEQLSPVPERNPEPEP